MGQDRSDTSKKQSCSASALLNNMPAMVFAKDAESGRYSSCNQSFAAYAHKSSPEGVVGLTDHEIFDRATADHFVADDKKALTLDEPYVFIEDVPDAKGNPRHFQTTKLKYIGEDGRLYVLGLCVDVTAIAKAMESEIRHLEQQRRHTLEERLLEEEKHRDQQEKMITALSYTT